MKFKKGDRVKVVISYDLWLPYAQTGWTGTIVRYFSVYEYIIIWDSSYNHEEKTGDLIKEFMIELIEKKKKVIKPFPIVKFLENVNARV